MAKSSKSLIKEWESFVAAMEKQINKGDNKLNTAISEMLKEIDFKKTIDPLDVMTKLVEIRERNNLNVHQQKSLYALHDKLMTLQKHLSDKKHPPQIIFDQYSEHIEEKNPKRSVSHEDSSSATASTDSVSKNTATTESTESEAVPFNTVRIDHEEIDEKENFQYREKGEVEAKAARSRKDKAERDFFIPPKEAIDSLKEQLKQMHVAEMKKLETIIQTIPDERYNDIEKLVSFRNRAEKSFQAFMQKADSLSPEKQYKLLSDNIQVYKEREKVLNPRYEQISQHLASPDKPQSLERTEEKEELKPRR